MPLTGVMVTWYGRLTHRLGIISANAFASGRRLSRKYRSSDP